MNITIKSHRASEAYDLCVRYAEAQNKALSQKLKNPRSVTTNNCEWFENQSVYLLTADIRETGELIGGIRVHLENGLSPLPVEVAIGHVDPSIASHIQQNHCLKGTGEVCGLWSLRSGYLIAEKLMSAAIALCDQLPLTHLYSFPGNHMFDFVSRFGFQKENSLGDQGHFNYPNDSYLSAVVSLDLRDSRHMVPSLKAEVLAITKESGWTQTYHLKNHTCTYQFNCLLWSTKEIKSHEGAF